MFVNDLCEVKGEQDGEADKPEESFCELVIAGGDAPIALNSFEEVFYPVRTSGRGRRTLPIGHPLGLPRGACQPDIWLTLWTAGPVFQAGNSYAAHV